MGKISWNDTRTWIAIKSEKCKYAFAKEKWLYSLPIIFVIIVVILKVVEQNWNFVEKIFENTALIGVTGTLLGALIGGVFTLVGAIGVGKHQLKAQTQVRRKNVIYKPLYDEIFQIHNKILKDNPYPWRVAFEEQPQTMLKYPQYTVWGRIKMDSRYLETPKKLSNILEQLESAAKEYLMALDNASTSIRNILNDVLKRELDVECMVG